jgi:hypothetical protein
VARESTRRSPAVFPVVVEVAELPRHLLVERRLGGLRNLLRINGAIDKTLPSEAMSSRLTLVSGQPFHSGEIVAISRVAISDHVSFSFFPLAVALSAALGLVVRTTRAQADVGRRHRAQSAALRAGL